MFKNQKYLENLFEVLIPTPAGDFDLKPLTDSPQIIKPSENDSFNINTIIQNGGNFLIKKGNYYVDEDIVLKSNTLLIFENGAIFNKKPTDSPLYYILKIHECDNVTIVNPTIIGDVDSHIGTTGEWGHGINVTNSDNIKILYPKISKCWGDGIYLGVEFYSTSLKKAGYMFVESPIIDSCRRNGISVCSGENVIINNSITKNINGTSPKAGIDIEPESGGTGLLPYLDKVTINGHTSFSCGSGLTIFLNGLINRDLKTTVVVNDHHDYASEKALYLARLEGSVDGNIKINNPIYTDSIQGAIRVWGYPSENSPLVTIDKPIIKNYNTSDNENVYFNNAITIQTTPHDVNLTYDIGNIDILNPIIENDLTTLRQREIYIQNFIAGYSAKKIKIINPYKIKTTRMFPKVINALDVVLEDNFKQITNHNLYFTQDVTNINVSTYFHNKDATSIISYNLKNLFPENVEVTFEVMTNQRMRIIPEITSTILPNYTVGKFIESQTIGSCLTIKRVGENWFIVRQIGTWTVQV